MTTSGDHMADGADRRSAPPVVVDDNGHDDQEATEAEEWREVINKVAAAVVVIRTTACRSFDTELLGSDSATGFVVDKQRGIILTNRHVVKPGPVVAQATFLNQEEIPIHPLYRDPVHDFGFFWYDPSALQFMKYEAIPLVPDIACVGLEIRVVGNDSGDKLSISAGTIARLDQDAPDYGGDGYNDFNTFYIQAASGTKGGSSGSPVIERQGKAVALNAGARTTSSTAFFLPLQRVVRALRLLQEGNESHSTTKWNSVCIPRGTLQTTFQYKGFNEVHRLGVKKEIEQMIRHASPGETGMLVVDSVVPNGPAYEHLEPGDVLLRLNEKITTNFLTLDSILDDHVEQIVELQIERGDKTLSMHIMVQDLNSITPDHFLEVNGAVIHPLSYQQARNFLFPCGIVFVSDPGYILERAGVPRCAIIKKLANVETPTIKEFIAILHKLPKGARASLEYITSNHRHKTRLALITIDHHEWYGSPKIYTRDDCSGLWNIVPVTSLYKDDYGETIDPTLLSNGLDHGGAELENDSSDDLHHLADDNATNPFSVRTTIEPSLVLCEVSIPSVCMTDGVSGKHYNGLGVVIHHSKTLGLIVVDRNTVHISACDVLLYFASCPVQISGQVVFIHPVYNYAILSYNPVALGSDGATMVLAAELLPAPLLRHGDSVFLVGINEHLGAIYKKTTVTNPFYSIHLQSAHYPHYKARNMEVIELDSDLGDTVPGVLCNEFGMVQALWGSFYTELESGNTVKNQIIRGIPIYMVSQVLEQMLHGGDSDHIGRQPPIPDLVVNENTRLSMPLVRVLEVEFFPRSLSRARSYGLNDYWIRALLKKDPVRKHVLRVISCSAGSKAADHLSEGDMLLAINGKPVTSYLDIENACKELDHKIDSHGQDSDGKLHLTIFRQGSEVNVDVETDVRDGNGTRRVINWSGCIIQETPPAVRAFGYLPEQGHGVYITTWFTGCPADRYSVWGCRWIVEVNGEMTPNLDAFLDVVKELEHDEFIKIKTIDLEGKPQVSTLKQDLRYWPTEELIFDPNSATWRRHTVKAFA